MKKTLKKLVLAKDTLRNLENETVKQAAGGSGGWTCTGVYCSGFGCNSVIAACKDDTV